MDKTHTLDQQTGRFRSVRDGLPELVKNSKDQYARLGLADRTSRQIVVLISPDARHLGVLDFAGARESDFDGWQTWSSRTAGRADQGQGIEAGHGNGGKAFMVQGAKREASMCSSAGGLLTKMGFKNDEPSLRYHPGWFERTEGVPIRSLPDPNPPGSLALELAQFGLGIADLPPAVRDAFSATGNFTLVHLDGVTDWVNATSSLKDELISKVPEKLQAHPQSSLTLETCTVWVMRGNHLLAAGPIGFVPPEPYPSLEAPIAIPIPVELVDPESGHAVAIPRSQNASAELILNTSQQNLRITDRTKALNIIRIRNARNVVAVWSVADLAPVAASAYVLGTLRYEDLPGEALVGSERQQLADSALIRAIRAWTATRVQELASRIQRLQASRDSPEDRSATNDALRALRDLMRKYISQDLDGGTTSGGMGDGGGRGPFARRPFGERVDVIELETPSAEITMAVGASIPIAIRCSQKMPDNKLRPVKGVNLVAEVDPPTVAEIVEESMLHALAAGSASVKIRTADGRIESNPIPVRSIELRGAQITPPPEALKQGERRRLGINATLADGTESSDLLHELAVDEPEMGRCGRAGVFTAGGHAGTATVRLRWGPGATDVVTAGIPIGEEKLERTGGRQGGDIPQILLCGQEAPGYDELPIEQRTQAGGRENPTIIDFDPIWQDEEGRDKIIWINPESTESLKVRSTRGSSGAMGLQSKTFRQFLALKAFEILRRLKVKNDLGDQTRSSTGFFQEMAQAELDCAGFLDAAYGLVENLGAE